MPEERNRMPNAIILVSKGINKSIYLRSQIYIYVKHQTYIEVSKNKFKIILEFEA